jgi:hypothetical protein
MTSMIIPTGLKHKILRFYRIIISENRFETIICSVIIELCEVHIIRSWERKLKVKIGLQNFNKQKKILTKMLCLLRGTFYIPTCFSNLIISELRCTILPKLGQNIQSDFENWIQYLEKNGFTVVP